MRARVSCFHLHNYPCRACLGHHATLHRRGDFRLRMVGCATPVRCATTCAVGFLLLPALATAWTTWRKFAFPIPPASVLLTPTGLGALAVNFACVTYLSASRAFGRRNPVARCVSVRTQRRARERRHHSSVLTTGWLQAIQA